MIRIDALGIGAIGDLPDALGRKLAEHVVQLATTGSGIDLSKLEIDVSHCPPGWLISTYFSEFNRVLTENALREAARKIQWRTRFDFQRDNIQRWVVLTDQPGSQP